MISNLFRFLICTSLPILLLNCANAAGQDENTYKRAAVKLSSILETFHGIPVLKAVEKKGNRDLIHLDNSKRQEFLLKERDQILSIKKQLQELASAFPEGKYAGDAKFCIALMDIFFFYPFTDIFKIKDDELQIILENSTDLVPSEWTKSTLKHYYDMFFERKESYDAQIMTESSFIKAGFYTFLITNFCQKRDYEKADSLIVRLKSQAFPSPFIDDFIEIIAQYKKVSSENIENTRDIK